jgi:hypothetical protein
MVRPLLLGIANEIHRMRLPTPLSIGGIGQRPESKKLGEDMDYYMYLFPEPKGLIGDLPSVRWSLTCLTWRLQYRARGRIKI